MEQQTIEKPQLFTELSAEEAATVNGAHYYYYGHYPRVRRVRYHYGYRRHRYSYYGYRYPRYSYASYSSYRPRYTSYYDCY